MKKRKEK